MAKPAKRPQHMRWAVITPSYNLDFKRCQLLCRSMDRFLIGPWHHYIIVDPVDLPLFKPLAGPQRTVINKQDILPKGFRYGGKIPFMRLGRFWFSFRHGPVFGWQMQQFVKIFMANAVTEEAMAFCDSDVFFLRPFDISTLERNGQVRFNRVENPLIAQNPDVASSVKIVGLDPKNVEFAWGGEQLVTWHRPTVIALQDHISKLHHKPWHEAIGMKLSFAEYHLYGTYVLYIDRENPYIFFSDDIYCKGLWTKEAAAKTNLRDFCKTLAPPQVAVCIQSLIGADMATITSIVDDAIAAK